MRKLIVLLVFAGALVSAKAQILPLDKQRLAALKEAYLHNNEQAVKMVGSYEVMGLIAVRPSILTPVLSFTSCVLSNSDFFAHSAL